MPEKYYFMFFRTCFPINIFSGNSIKKAIMTMAFCFGLVFLFDEHIGDRQHLLSCQRLVERFRT
jgi:hypothetical protein